MDAEREVSPEQTNLRAFSGAELFERFKTSAGLKRSRISRINFLWAVLSIDNSPQRRASGFGNV
jgi:hypothetical protein